MKSTCAEVLTNRSSSASQPEPTIPPVDYHFVSDAEFDGLVSGGQMLEWALVHGTHRYGTPRGPVQAQLDAGRDRKSHV